MTPRRLILRLHLTAGLVCGLFIALLSATGALLSFETEWLEWAEASALHAAPPSAESARLPFSQLEEKLREQQPGLKISGWTLSSNPHRALIVSGGREDPPLAVNPWTGEARKLDGLTRRFLAATKELHRWLLLGKEARPIGKAITGSASLAFFFLGLTGLILWWPRQLRRAWLRRITWFQGGLRGKARDWNWHHVLGFWGLPLFVIITLSGAVLSFHWAESLAYKVVGDELKEARREPARPIPAPQPGATALAPDEVLRQVAQQTPGWKSLSLRFSEGRPSGPATEKTPEANRPGRDASRPDKDAARPAKDSARPALLVMVRLHEASPAFATSLLTVDPFTGALLKEDSFASQSAGKRLKAWLRYLHTGEAFGLLGKSLGFLAALASLILCYTGFSLYFRKS